MSAMIPAGHDGQWTQFSLHAVSVTMIISMTDHSARSWPQVLEMHVFLQEAMC